MARKYAKGPFGTTMRRISWRKRKGLWKGRVNGSYWFYIRHAENALTFKPYILSSRSPLMLGAEASFDTLDECKDEAQRRMVLLVEALIARGPNG